MSISDVIKSRRATPPRFLLNTELEKDVVAEILENANWAPNHKKTEPWRFQVFTGKSKEKLANEIFSLLTEKINSGEEINLQKVEKLKATLLHVPVAIIVIFERDVAERIPEWEEIAAVSMAVQNMWLTATELDLGAFWATPVFLPMLDEIFALNERQKNMGFFYLGKIAIDYPSPGRGEISEKVDWK